MAIAYDTQHQLDHLLTSSGIDLSARNAIIKYLMDDGLLTGGTKSGVWVQNEDLPPPVFPPLDKAAQVLLLDSPAASVTTDSNLKVIVDNGDAQLTVKGPNDVLVVAGDDVNLIDLKGTTGNDMVIAGAGANTIGGSQGYDYGNGNLWGDGHNTIGGGNNDTGKNDTGNNDTGNNDTGNNDTGNNDTGNNDTGNNDTGNNDTGNNDTGNNDTGNNDTGNNDTGNNDTGNNSTMGGGNDGSGDHGGTTTTLMAGSGNDTLTGDHGNYLFEVGFHNEGSASITGSSGGVNTVDFEGSQDTLANATITTVHGVTTVDFKDGQDYTLTNIEHLDFHK